MYGGRAGLVYEVGISVLLLLSPPIRPKQPGISSLLMFQKSFKVSAELMESQSDIGL